MNNPAGQHLVDIHDHLRSELDQMHDVIDQVRRGLLTVGAARGAVNAMTMRQNNWTLGGFCQAYCRVVTGHHTLEDTSVFPHLREREPALGPVLDRLSEEHVVIHDLLDAFDRALVGLVTADPQGRDAHAALDGVQEAAQALDERLREHLAYEESELVEPLGRHGFF